MATSLLKLLLVPVVLLAQALCLCGHAEAAPIEPEHACCQSQVAGDHDAESPHDPQCPHCGDNAPQKTLADRPAADAHVAVPPPTLIAFDVTPAPASATLHPATTVAATPADRALVTCVRLN
jgi:hypothetical protein